MSNSTVTIGTITLQDFEVPTSIQFGGRQRLVIHRLSNGTRTIEPLGPDDSEVRFEGIFSGADAEIRARALNGLRIAGSVVWLRWQSFQYRVIISSFTATYRNRWWICYRLSCVVVHQSGTQHFVISEKQSIISGALATAANALLGSPVNLTSLSSVIATDNAFTPGTTDHANAILVAGNSMLAAQQQVDQQSDILTSFNQHSDDPVLAASSFGTQLAGAASLAYAVGARSYIGLAVKGLNSPEG